MWPFLLEDGYEDKIELVQKGPLAFQAFFGVRSLDDKVHDEVPNPCVALSARPVAAPYLLTLTLFSW